ncbi:MAG TPA: antibiotic biosynthesis monooxygenase [Tahibacter sp.]|uniref:antibiotic biosynthesis monooxygenase family protein n=1 Tax=Tahibacter sp. TaxID=2056211 RepID=UPI002C565B1F|nr:antibiotic biosynthesis monooxygenase [Tahibacter sp.]HSX60154.1 antibiotic biosynthesis monooxygenase [Tahibacter sp.]
MRGYAYVWAFRVAEARRAEFERVYGPDGPWVALFAQADGYLGTSLLADRAQAGRYLTIDRWRDEAAHEAFRARFAERYAALDRACEGLAEHEQTLGHYDLV